MSPITLFRRTASDEVVKWTEDAKLVKNRAALANVEAILAGAQSRLAAHDQAVAAAEEAVRRAQLEALAGKGSDAQLAEKQAQLIQTQRSRAVDVLRVEDAEVERRSLADSLPQIELAAKRRSAAALRRQFLAIAGELKASLDAVSDADMRMAALYRDAEQQFPGNDQTTLDASGHVRRELQQAAGIPNVFRTGVNSAGMAYWQRVSSVAGSWSEQVERALAHVGKLAADHDK